MICGAVDRSYHFRSIRRAQNGNLMGVVTTPLTRHASPWPARGVSAAADTARVRAARRQVERFAVLRTDQGRVAARRAAGMAGLAHVERTQFVVGAVVDRRAIVVAAAGRNTDPLAATGSRPTILVAHAADASALLGLAHLPALAVRAHLARRVPHAESVAASLRVTAGLVARALDTVPSLDITATRLASVVIRARHDLVARPLDTSCRVPAVPIEQALGAAREWITSPAVAVLVGLANQRRFRRRLLFTVVAAGNGNER
jgi:hypothetical protein